MSILFFKKICAPALLYLIISIISIVLGLIITVGGTPLFCLGNNDCDISFITIYYFLIHFFYHLYHLRS